MASAAALSPYPSPDEREAELEALAARSGAELVRFGTSGQGRPLRAARLPCGDAAAAARAPRVACIANLHGVEWIGGRVALGLLAAAGGGAADALRARAELWIIPCANPDGYARTHAQQGRGTLAELRTNGAGVDLNRNFPLPGGARPTRLPGAGSSRAGDATYRGTGPLSEPEARALDRLLGELRPHGSVSLHSTMGTLIPPRVLGAAPFAAYGGLCRAFRAAQPRWRYVRLASRLLDVFTGELEDHQHHAHDSWALCVEVFTLAASLRQHLRAPSLFWRFNPREPGPWVDNDVPAIVAYLEAALALPRPAALGLAGRAPRR